MSATGISEQAAMLRSSSQVKEALDFSSHPECPSLNTYARFNQPRDLPKDGHRYGVRNTQNEFPMMDVVQPDRKATPAEVYEKAIHEDYSYSSHQFPLEKSKVIRKPEELNPVIFDENHVFGGIEDKGLSAAETLKPVHMAPPLQTSSDPCRFLPSSNTLKPSFDGYNPSDTILSSGSTNDLTDTISYNNRRFYNHYTNIGPLQKQDPKRTALECTVDRGYSDSFNPNERFGIRSNKTFTDTTEACVRPINGARESIPYSREYIEIHRLPQTIRATKNDFPVGKSPYGPSSDKIYGAPSDRMGSSVKDVVQSCGFDDRGCVDATSSTNYQKMRKDRYGYKVPDGMVFGHINNIDSHTVKPTCIGGDADGTEWGVINHLDLYAPQR